MSKIGFWDGLFGDVGYYERQAINSNSDNIDILMASQSASMATLSRRVQALHTMDHAQSMELARLRVMVRVLSEMIVEQGGGGDADAVAKRMEGALDELENQQAEATQKAASTEPTTTCSRCQQTVLARKTVITSEGNVCDRCFY